MEENVEIKYFELLSIYNRRANSLMNDIIKTITEEEWNEPPRPKGRGIV
jgi:hypothetical protein